MPLTLSYAEERGQAPSRDPHTGEGRGGNPHVHEPKSFYKVKIDGKSKWAPGGRGVRPRAWVSSSSLVLAPALAARASGGLALLKGQNSVTFLSEASPFPAHFVPFN